MAGLAKASSAALGIALAAGLSGCAPLGIAPETAATPAAQPTAAAGDPCGAQAFQALVGDSVGGLDAATLPDDRRVIFPGMAVTQDYRPERLNVEIGPDDRITRIYCG
jgi:hypothetical protein